MSESLSIDNFSDALDNLERILRNNDVSLVVTWALIFAEHSNYSEYQYSSPECRLEVLIHKENIEDHNQYFELQSRSHRKEVRVRYRFKISEIVEASDSLKRFLSLKAFL